MKYMFLTIFISIILLLSCSTSTESISSPGMKGKVTDRSGNPIAGVIIELNYHLEPVEELKKNENTENKLDPKPTTYISYSLPKTVHVKLWITRYNSSKIVKTLVDEQKPAGMHSIAWDATNSNGNNIVSGIYEYHIEASDYKKSQIILFLATYDRFNEIDNLEYYAKTDKNGNFSISHSELDFNHDVTIMRTEVDGNSLGEICLNEYIDIWVLHNDYVTAYSDSVYVKPDQENKIDFQMELKPLSK